MLNIVARLTRLTPVRQALTGTLLGFFLMSLLPASLHAAREGGKTEVLSVQLPLPPAPQPTQAVGLDALNDLYVSREPVRAPASVSATPATRWRDPFG